MRIFPVLGSLLFLFFFSGPSQDLPVFDDFFTDHTLRIDYYHTGDSVQELVTMDRMVKQGPWAGNPNRLLDMPGTGRYCIKVFHSESGKLIYSKGFDSYFGEYKTSTPAIQGEKKTFHETALIPYPREKIRFVIERRDRNHRLHSLYEKPIDPRSIEIHRESPGGGVRIFRLAVNGSPHQKVDLAILAEGYRSEEVNKVENDFKRVVGEFFQQEPYKSHRNHFNVTGVFKPSDQSGCDEPRRMIFKNTCIGATFNSLGLERYLLTENNRALRDIAAHAPYDAVLIMVNHRRYGGGGIYNFYCTFTIDNQWFPYLLLHEFGHSFTGLADEYYASTTAYNDFYPRGIEPLEPNITALLQPGALKWRQWLSPGIQVPTPWNKKEFDRMGQDYQKERNEINRKIARLVREDAPEEKIREARDESERLSRENARKISRFLALSPYRGKVGAFLGAGYSSRGLYRPMVDCIMFTTGKKPYCRVCEAAIVRVIRSYTD